MVLMKGEIELELTSLTTGKDISGILLGLWVSLIHTVV
jgi:hypothetical protein